MSGAEDFFRRIKQMTKQDRDHFQGIVERLVQCYGEDAAQAVIVFSYADASQAEALTLNCDEMDALALVQSVHNHFILLNTANAPPKEKFN
jgi:hypothetical protein